MLDDLQKQVSSSRNQIEQLNEELEHLEKKLQESKEDKFRLIQSELNGDDQADERQNLLRQITMEKVRRQFSFSSHLPSNSFRINTNNK